MPYVEYDEVRAVCSDCGRQFPSEDDLRVHQAETHRGGEARPSTGGLSQVYACALCQKKFRTVATLSEHNRRVHTG